MNICRKFKIFDLRVGRFLIQPCIYGIKKLYRWKFFTFNLKKTFSFKKNLLWQEQTTFDTTVILLETVLDQTFKQFDLNKYFICIWRFCFRLADFESRLYRSLRYASHLPPVKSIDPEAAKQHRGLHFKDMTGLNDFKAVDCWFGKGGRRFPAGKWVLRAWLNGSSRSWKHIRTMELMTWSSLSKISALNLCASSFVRMCTVNKNRVVLKFVAWTPDTELPQRSSVWTRRLSISCDYHQQTKPLIYKGI